MRPGLSMTVLYLVKLKNYLLCFFFTLLYPYFSHMCKSSIYTYDEFLDQMSALGW